MSGTRETRGEPALNSRLILAGMVRPSETAQVDIGPDEIAKSSSCSNGSYMNDVSLVIYLNYDVVLGGLF